MRAFIQKTLIAKEWIPTAEIVARAFEILTELSASARESLDNNLLLQWESPFYTEPQAIIDIVSDEAINMFAALVNTPSYEQKDGTSGEWHWTTHQFRRFFSVLYFYRYRGAKLEDLAHFLRHFDLDMTRKYLEITPQQKKEFEEVGRMYFGDIAKELLAQAGQSFGAGKALKKMLEDHFHANVHLSAPALEDVDEFADRLKSTRNIQVHPKPWVDCTCPLTKEGAKTAACAVHRLEPEAVGPELTFARPSVCAGCAHPIPNQHFDGYLELEERGVAVLADADIFKGTLLQGVAKARIIEIRSIRGEVSCV